MTQNELPTNPFAALQDAAERMAKKAGNIPGSTGIIISFPDRHPGQLAIVAAATAADHETRTYLVNSLQGHRVDGTRTTLGAMHAGEQGRPLEDDSRLNPDHRVFGARFGEAVVQLAIDRRLAGIIPSSSDFADIVNPHGPLIQTELNLIQQSPGSLEMLALKEPVTPNAVVWLVDMKNSTGRVREHNGKYEIERDATFEKVSSIGEMYGGETIKSFGDQRRLAFYLPPTVNVGNPDDVQRYYETLASPVTEAFDLADIGKDAHVIHGVGHIQETKDNGLDGAIFYDLAELIKQQAKQS